MVDPSGKNWQTIETKQAVLWKLKILRWRFA
jgi:hypothetical protein